MAGITNHQRAMILTEGMFVVTGSSRTVRLTMLIMSGTKQRETWLYCRSQIVSISSYCAVCDDSESALMLFHDRVSLRPTVNRKYGPNCLIGPWQRRTQEKFTRDALNREYYCSVVSLSVRFAISYRLQYLNVLNITYL